MAQLLIRHVFISYSRRDDIVMRRTVDFLRKQGIKIWVDNEKLTPGTPIWEEEIEKAINNAYAVVVMLSPDAKNSEWVRREITYADQYRKRVFPVLVNGDEDASIPLRLITRQFVDIRANENIGLNSLTAAITFYAEEIEALERKERKEAEILASVQAEREAAKHEAAQAKSERDATEKNARDAIAKAAREKVAREAAEEKARLATERAANLNPFRLLQLNPKWYLLIGFIGLCCISSVIWGTWYLATEVFPTQQTLVPATSIPTVVLTQSETSESTVIPNPQELLDTDPAGNEIAMRLVPAGQFIMGSKAEEAYAKCPPSPDCWFDDEIPPHTISLDAFYIDTYEITNALFSACVEAGACDLPRNTNSNMRDTYYENSGFDDYPVIYVDWNMAKNYCEWRGAELPTEAQWEKAARGMDANLYSWGQEIDCDRANYSECVGDTSQVGNYETGISPYGIYDMAGNVWEWVADWYDAAYYANSPSSNPQGPATSPENYRTVRGGSWFDSDFLVRASYRNEFPPETIENNIGFRCARSLP